MRQLTKKQKAIIGKWFQKNTKVYPCQSPVTPTFDDFPDELYKELEKINDTEILYQEVERYIDYLIMES